MTYIVHGRPPGTITYERRSRSGATHKVVRRRRGDVKLRSEPFSSRAAAEDAARVAHALGWRDLLIAGRPWAPTRQW